MFLTSHRHFPFFRFLLAAFIGWMWARSHARCDLLAIFLHRGNAQVIMSDHGRVTLFVSNLSLGSERAYTYDRVAMRSEEFEFFRVQLLESPPLPQKVVGLLLGASKANAFGLAGAKYDYLSIPYWMVAAVFGLPLGLGMRTFWRRRRWDGRQYCAHCGYDLRASLGRCPECGAKNHAETPVKIPTNPVA